MYTYKYPHPAITADCVVLGFDGTDLKLLLIERKSDPYAGCWAFPGGFMNIDETAEEAANRELMEETHFKCEGLRQFYVSSTVNRDERERVVTVACLAFVKIGKILADDDANRAEWVSLKALPKLAFDHKEILEVAKRRLKEMLHFDPYVFSLLPKSFTLDEVRNLFECILEISIDKSEFEASIAKLGIVKVLNAENGLYVFDADGFEKYKNSQYRFSF